MVCLTTSAVRSMSLPRYDCSSQLTLPSSLSQFQPALNPALLQPFLPLQLSQLLLGSAFGVPSLPLVIVQALILESFLICIFQGQYAPEFANSAGHIQSFGRVFYDIHKGECCRQEISRGSCLFASYQVCGDTKSTPPACKRLPAANHMHAWQSFCRSCICSHPGTALHKYGLSLQQPHPPTRSACMQQLRLLLAKLHGVSH